MRKMWAPPSRPAFRILRVGWMLAFGLVTIVVDAEVNSPGQPFRAPDARADASLPSLTVCAAAEWVITNPTPDSVVYECRSVCPAQDGSECTYATIDVLGNALQTMAFVVDSMGGQMRWNTPPEIVAGVLQHYGGTGTAYTSDIYGADIRALWVEFENEGYRLVEPKWETGIAGWFSRKNGDPTSLPALLVRPAAVIQWARAYLIPSSVKFATIGCSGGSIATFGPVYWLGLAPIVDYQYLSGALPGVYDIPAACAKTQSTYGICENDPTRSCRDDRACGDDYRCAFPQPIGSLGSTSGNPLGESVKALIDYVGVTGGKCVAGQSDPSFYRSSFKYVPGNLSYEYPIDLDIGIGGHPYWWTDPDPVENQQYPNLMTDTNLGVTYNTGKIYTEIQSNQYKTHTLFPGTHCESQLNSSHLPDVLNKIRSGLGVTPLPR